MKKLIIDKCKNCPYIGHSGGFGNISNIPKCTKMDERTLPYTGYTYGGIIVAKPVDQIPEWCPLEDISVSVDRIE